LILAKRPRSDNYTQKSVFRRLQTSYSITPRIVQNHQKSSKDRATHLSLSSRHTRFPKTGSPFEITNPWTRSQNSGSRQAQHASTPSQMPGVMNFQPSRVSTFPPPNPWTGSYGNSRRHIPGLNQTSRTGAQIPPLILRSPKFFWTGGQNAPQTYQAPHNTPSN